MHEKNASVKSMELTAKKNNNMIDGIMNNGLAPVLLPRKSYWIRDGRSRPNAAKESVRSVDEKAPRCIHLNIIVTPKEQELIYEHMAEAGIQNMGPICGKWLSMGMCSMSIYRMCGNRCLCSGVVQIISTEWQSMPMPMTSTPQRSLHYKKTMQTCGVCHPNF